MKKLDNLKELIDNIIEYTKTWSITETDNLYEYFNGKLSLVGTNVSLLSYEDLMRMSGTGVLA